MHYFQDGGTEGDTDDLKMKNPIDLRTEWWWMEPIQSEQMVSAVIGFFSGVVHRRVTL